AQRGSKIRIMGHTDARPLISRSGKTNWDLSYERASNARRVLDASGLAKGQITSVQAHGSSQLRNPADPLAAENRRLSVLVLLDPQAAAANPAPAAPAPAVDAQAAAATIEEPPAAPVASEKPEAPSPATESAVAPAHATHH
ncbi:MAG TPA: OmpA family protein, partial [Candidatus Acidoferrum sp.]|nr:OmpA family protein [Candidatus Acidoferrum sp.]